ncbi:unnamed protein product, partial [Scytosiphon promiscuus]
ADQTAFRTNVDASSEDASCRCALLYSGHVRSFAQPRVYLSHKENLIKQLEVDCQVDVFLYISVEDQVPSRRNMGKFADALAFTAHSPSMEEVENAVGLLNPIAIKYHQEQAGLIPNACEVSCKVGVYWQLYKLKAVYRMMEDHESRTALSYTWVVRSRLDIAWMLPMLPLGRFRPSRVYTGHNFFPLADQFLLVPRRFAKTVFGAVRMCFDCKSLQKQQESKIQAQTETLLHMALRQEGVPFGYYEFPTVIVRSNEGGVCGVLHPHKVECEMLRVAGLIGPSATSDSKEGALSTAISCTDIMNRWYRQACVEMFPPRESSSSETARPAAIGVGGDENGADLIRGDIGVRRGRNAVADIDDGIERGGDDTTRSRGGLGPAATFAGVADGVSTLSFDEATRRVDGIQDDLRDLLGGIKVHADPNESYLNYFVAHHYPFHLPNDGPLDEVNIIEGYRVSEVDFNRLALSFSCLLSDVTSKLREAETAGGLPTSATHDHVQGGIGDGDESGADDADTNLLVLKTTAPAEEEGLEAFVNCSLAEPLPDVRISLLDNTFEPLETICRGFAQPCL